MLLSQAQKKQKGYGVIYFRASRKKGPKNAGILVLDPCSPQTPAGPREIWPPAGRDSPLATAGGWGWEVWGHMMQGNPQEKEPQPRQKTCVQ